MSLCIVSCTNRKNAQTFVLSKYIHTLLPKDSPFIDLAQIPLQEIKNFYKDSSKIQKELDIIHQCRGVILVIPEYNGSFPGIFKYFIDHWSLETFLNRAFYIIGVGSSRDSGVLAVRDAQNVLIHQGGLIYPKRSCVHIQFIRDGKLLESPTRDHIETHIEKFKLFAQKMI